MKWTEEIDTIARVAAEYGIDPLFLAAIRAAENGGPGREFGIMTEGANTYDAQLRGACATVRNQLDRFDGRQLALLDSYTGRKRVCYAAAFIADLGARYAGAGAANDPGNLNANWIENVAALYLHAVTQGPLTLA